ncbi:MAG: type IV pilin protein [Arenimonas sp.]
MKKQLGFTLLELMVVVAVIAILAAIALTSYRNQLIKSKRAEGKQVVSDYALRLEKWRLNNATYTSTLANINGVSPSPSGYYTIALSTPTGGNCPNTTNAIGSANSFRITATAAGDQADDTKCATMVLSSICGTVSKTSTPAGNTCW